MIDDLERWRWRLAALILLGVVAYFLLGTYRSLLAPALHVDLGSRAGVPPRSSVPLPGRPVAILDSPHIPYLGARHPPYDSVPPTSGPHVPWTVATGVYSQQIPEELQIHALEHGHILIQYSPRTVTRTVQILGGFARRNLHKVVVAPYSKLKSGISLTAWGRIELLSTPDERRMQLFVDRLSGRYVHGWRR
jgi:hypothetical protein